MIPPKGETRRVDGTDAFVRSMSFAEMVEFQEQVSDDDPVGATRLMVHYCLSDADGKRLGLDLDDLPAAFVMQVAEAAMRLNLPGEDLAGNSASAGAEDSRSG